MQIRFLKSALFNYHLKSFEFGVFSNMHLKLKVRPESNITIGIQLMYTFKMNKTTVLKAYNFKTITIKYTYAIRNTVFKLSKKFN